MSEIEHTRRFAILSLSLTGIITFIIITIGSLLTPNNFYWVITLPILVGLSGFFLGLLALTIKDIDQGKSIT